MMPDRKEPWTVKAFRLGSAGALLLSQVSCLPRKEKNPDASPPPTTSSETTPAISPPITSPATEISPSSGVGETIVIAEQRYMSQQEVLAVDPLVESKFREFQEEIKVNNPSATFAAWGALATAQTGETYFTPFFEVYNDGNLISEYVNIGKIDGSIATLELKPGEVEGPDGKIYVSLSQTVNADTNELLETPLPYTWIPYSRAEYNALSDDEKTKVPVYFSAIPGIVPQNEAPVYGGAKTESIRMIIATPETPGSISSKEILAECPVKLEISEVLVGKARVEGQEMEFNYPNVKLDITFGLHPSIMNMGQGTELSPYQEIMINPEFEDRFGIKPEIQIMTDILYTHYRAWQNDEDNKYISERAGVSFLEYLKMLDQGEDGTHKLWVVSEKGKLYPNERVTVGPGLRHVVIFAESGFGEGGSGAGLLKFDKINSELIIMADPISHVTTDPNEPVKHWGYLDVFYPLGFMIMPEKIQRLGFSSSTPKEMSRYFRKFNSAIFSSEELWFNTPLILIPHGFSP